MRAEAIADEEDYSKCDSCDGSGWTLWYTELIAPGTTFDLAYRLAYPRPACMFVACADCNDDAKKPYPAPWPVCPMCEEQRWFCKCGRIFVN